MQIIPTQPVAKQKLQVLLSGQQTQLNIYTTIGGLFMDVLLDNAPVIQGVLCQNLNPIVRNTYLGYSGDFAWIDQLGDTDPVYTDLGSRYVLAYLNASEITS